MWSYVSKLHGHFYLKILLIDFFSIYRTSAASSDEMELWSCFDNSSQLQTLNFFDIEPYLISYSSGKIKNNASSLCHL